MLLANRARPNRRFVPCMPGKLGMQGRVAFPPSAGEEMKEEKMEDGNENESEQARDGVPSREEGKGMNK
ncbi:uncharacterized protein LY79DRAFT_550296 [Colletotrichum navitas]|uniref:Uncharacterized protein n=1 Tax=Colletotrichum navitas TaxID=681940 RepID=A0AAD8V7C6_9PEZI|nr:uncharacterized protein LY79DRAFT_550296 [Colletotrichum navitas]KAK1594260.1 hypothetical protein LY79DRAFT_550296 [Colletotrichum navitas]